MFCSLCESGCGYRGHLYISVFLPPIVVHVSGAKAVAQYTPPAFTGTVEVESQKDGVVV